MRNYDPMRYRDEADYLHEYEYYSRALTDIRYRMREEERYYAPTPMSPVTMEEYNKKSPPKPNKKKLKRKLLLTTTTKGINNVIF